MNAGVEINAVYEKFVSIFGFLVSLYERGTEIDARFPLLSKVSEKIKCRLNLVV